MNIESISEKDDINVSTLYQIMNNLPIDGVYFLKIDTEGHDTIILKKFYEENQRNMFLPHVIQFESNILTRDEDINQIIQLFTNIGYDVIQKSSDTILKLNLKKLVNKNIFTERIEKYYFEDYQMNYHVTELPYENTLEGAKDYCIKNNYSGVTLHNGIYHVCNGKYINYYSGDIFSWIFV